jgi:hypothetical protein
MRTRIALLSSVLILAGVSFAEEKPKSCWTLGILKKVGGAIGGETTGWQVAGIDAEGDAAEFAKLEGKRVAAWGDRTVKEWTERGSQPLVKVRRLEALEEEKDDLKFVGKVALAGSAAGTKHPVRVAIVLDNGKKELSAERHFVVATARADGSYDLVLPAIQGMKNAAYRIVAWVDDDEDGLCNPEKEACTAVESTTDSFSFSFGKGGWSARGSTPVQCTSPYTCNLRIEGK